MNVHFLDLIRLTLQVARMLLTAYEYKAFQHAFLISPSNIDEDTHLSLTLYDAGSQSCLAYI